MTRQHARRQRRERLVGILLAALGVAVLIVALYALRSPKGHSANAGKATTTTTVTETASASKASSSSAKASPTKTRTSPPASSTSSATTSKLPLVVLNNTLTPGLAARAQSRFQAGGWTVTSTANLTNNILSTCAYYDPAVSGAQAAATALQAQFPAIKRTAPKFDGLPAGPVVVVLTSDYS